MANEPENVVLPHLQGLRREMVAMLERQVRDRELVSRIYKKMTVLRSEVQQVRSEVHELRSDSILVENQMQNRHNEVLEIIRRLDPPGTPSD